MSIKDKHTILDLLHKFSSENNDFSWKINCIYSNGDGITMNQITILALTDHRNVGTFTYQVETGKVHFCSYKALKKPKSENIIDLLLDMINYSKALE